MNNKKNWLAMMLALVMILSMVPAVAEAPQTRIFVDDAGREVEIPAAPLERIAPSGKVAHIVLSAVAQDKLVCLSNPWTKDAEGFFPEAVLNLPVIGQFYGDGTLNMEALAACDPQVIVDIGEMKKTIAEDMDAVQQQLGIPVIFIEATMESMHTCYELLGDLLGTDTDAVVDYCADVYRRTIERMHQIGDDNKIKAVYCLGADGLSVLGKGSYHAEILDVLIDNAAVIESPSSKAFGDQVDMEQLLLWDPEFIVFAPDVDMDAVLKDPAWQQLRAVANGNYAIVPAAPFNWMGFPPSVNRYIGMIWLANRLYPEVFTEDMYHEAKTYYLMFYGYDLSQDKFNELIGVPNVAVDTAA